MIEPEAVWLRPEHVGTSFHLGKLGAINVLTEGHSRIPVYSEFHEWQLENAADNRFTAKRVDYEETLEFLRGIGEVAPLPKVRAGAAIRGVGNSEGIRGYA